MQIGRLESTLVNSDTRQEEIDGCQDFEREKHTLDYRFYRCRRLTLRLLPLSIAHWGSVLQLPAHGRIFCSNWTHLLGRPENHPFLRPR